MLEEEKEFNAKIQRFYDSLKDIPSLYRDNPWFEPQQSVISVQPSFWDWFDDRMWFPTAQECMKQQVTCPGVLLG